MGTLEETVDGGASAAFFFLGNSGPQRRELMGARRFFCIES